MKRDVSEDQVQLPDDQLLDKLTGYLSDKGDAEGLLKIFMEMSGRLGWNPACPLSRRQRRWAEDMYLKFELDVEEGAANLVSSGKVKVTPEERAKKFGYEAMPRPLRPPGRNF